MLPNKKVIQSSTHWGKKSFLSINSTFNKIFELKCCNLWISNWNLGAKIQILKVEFYDQNWVFAPVCIVQLI